MFEYALGTLGGGDGGRLEQTLNFVSGEYGFSSRFATRKSSPASAAFRIATPRWAGTARMRKSLFSESPTLLSETMPGKNRKP
jgi:hypothetical protein